jgi:hypothetical protein
MIESVRRANRTIFEESMALLIEMPVTIYRTFLGRRPSLSREYELLKNAVVSRAPVYVRLETVVECLCELDDAELLLTRAKISYPLASSYIEEGILLSQNTFDAPQIEYRKTAVGSIWHCSSNCTHWPTANFVLSDSESLSLNKH